MIKVSDKSKLVFLAGLSGGGKSTVGVELARIAKRSFVDIDEQIVERESQSIGDLFAARGEATFRRIESTVLEETLSKCKKDETIRYVISLGGGALISSENVELVKEHGLLIYLEVSAQCAARRLLSKSDRPLALAADGAFLSVAALEDRLAELLAVRIAGYHQADLVVSAAGSSVSDICQTIQAAIKF